MPPELFAALANAFIGFLIGTFVTLIGFRIVGKRPGEDIKYDAWHQRWGRSFKVGGLAVIFFSALTAIARVAGWM